MGNVINNNFKYSQIKLLLIYIFSIFLVILGVSLGFFNDSMIHQKWVFCIAVGITLAGFAGVFFGYFSILGVVVDYFIDFMKWIKSFFYKVKF